jgi:hypothetical protein
MFRHSQFSKFCSFWILLAFVFGQSTPFFAGQSFTYFICKHLNERFCDDCPSGAGIVQTGVVPHDYLNPATGLLREGFTVNNSESGNESCCEHRFSTVNLTSVRNNKDVQFQLSDLSWDFLPKPKNSWDFLGTKNIISHSASSFVRAGIFAPRKSHVSALLRSNHAILV